MRRVNFRFLLTTIACVLVLAGAIHAVHTRQYGKHASSWKRLAEDAKAAENHPLQIDYLRRYTALVKNDAAAFEELGDLLIKSIRFREAQLPLATALTLYDGKAMQSDVERLRRSLVTVALKTGRWSDAELELNSLIVPEPPTDMKPQQAEYHEQLAVCRLALGQWQLAAEELQIAIALDPSRCGVYGMLADLKIRQLDEPLAAVRLLRSMVARNAEEAQAYRIRATFRLQQLTNESARRAEAAIAADDAGGSEIEAAEAAVDPETGVPDPTATASDAIDDATELPPPMPPGELLELAASDAERALQLAPEDLNVKLLVMSCAHQLQDTVAPAQAEVHRDNARKYAESVIASCNAEVETRVAEFRKGLAATQAKVKHGTSDSSAEAQKTLDSAVLRITSEVFQQAVPAFNVQADLALREGDSAGAIRALADGLEKVNSDQSLLLNLASLRILQSQGAGEAAEVDRLLATLGRQRDAQPLVDFLRARQMMGRGDWRAAANALANVKPKLARWPAAITEAELGIAACQLQLGRPQVAQELYAEILESDPLSISARWGLALALEAQGRRGDAYPHFLQIAQAKGTLARNTGIDDLPVRTLRAMIERNVGRPPESQDWTSATKFIADARIALAAAGDTDVHAQAEMLDVIEAELLTARNDVTAATQLLSSALEHNQASVPRWVALITLYNRQERWDAAGQALQEARAAVGDSDPVAVIQLQLTEATHHLQRLLAALKSGSAAESGISPEQTKSIVLSIIDSLPEWSSDDRNRRGQYLLVKERFADLALALGDETTATRLYREISVAESNHLRSRFALLELALRHGQVDGVEEILDEVKVIDGEEGPLWNYCEATRLAIIAADEKLRDELAQAERCLQIAERAWPGSVRVRLLRSYIYRRQGRSSDAVDNDLQMFRDGYATPQFIKHLVSDLYELQRFEDAAGILIQVRPDAPAELAELAPTAMAVSGVVRDQTQSQQLRSLAVSLARTAAVDTGDYRVKLAYGMTLLQNQDSAAARREFELARDLVPAEPEPWLLLIELDARAGEQARAKQTLELAAQSIRETDRDIALARAYQMLNEPELSRKHLVQALAAIPEDLATATPGQVETLHRAAEAYFQRAQQEETLARSASSPEAASQHQQAVAEFEATGIKLLDRLVTDGSRALVTLDAATTSAGDHAATRQKLRNSLPPARRRLALAVLAMGGRHYRDRARRLIEDNRTREGLKDEDARLLSIISSQSPSRDDKLQALAEIENLIKRSDTPRDEDRLIAATLHLTEYRHYLRLSKSQLGANKNAAARENAAAQRHLTAARNLMHSIIVNHDSKAATGSAASTAPPTPSYLQALVGLIEILLINEDVREAGFYVAQLTAVAPRAQATISAIANVHFSKGEHSAAIDVVKRFAADAGPDQLESSALVASQLLEALGARARAEVDAKAYFDEAEQLLVSLPPPAEPRQLLLAGFRARHGRGAEAIELIEGVAGAVTDVQLVSACVHAMRAAGSDGALLQRLVAALEGGLALRPESIRLTLMLADLHTWIGEIGQAEAYYRKVLAADPKHAAAANNLSFLLASERRELDEALNLINGVIDEQGPLTELIDTRAYVYLRRGEPEKAAVNLSLALAENYQPSYLFHRAQAYLAMNRRTEAIGDWKQAAASGLAEAGLHPLEWSDFRQVASELDTL